MRNFTHGDSTLPKILLYQGNGYFKSFTTRLQQCHNHGIAFAFSSAFSISPSHVDTAEIVLDVKDSDEEDTVDTFGGTQTNGYNTETEDKVDWYTPPPPLLTPSPPPPPTLPVISPLSKTFEFGMGLSFYDGSGQAKTVVYEGFMPDNLTHTVWCQDGMRLNVQDAHLHLKMQADLSNIPRTPLDYCKEVGKGITNEEAENIAHPRILMPIQQE
jgi:hypothetical protein